MSEFQQSDFENNPYRSPSESGLSPFADGEGGQLVTPTVLALLAQTQPWVRFLSVLGFLVSALMLFGGLVGFLVTMGRGMGFICLIYVPLALLYFIPSLFLFRYASQIAYLRSTRSVQQLEDALAAQKSFWKFVGIAAMILIVIYFLAFVAAFLIPLLMHATSSR